MTGSDESERRLAEALRARATGAARNTPVPRPIRRSAARSVTSARTALFLALLGGAVLGMLLALVSLLAPGALPPVG